jgi:hypothetical protein
LVELIRKRQALGLAAARGVAAILSALGVWAWTTYLVCTAASDCDVDLDLPLVISSGSIFDPLVDTGDRLLLAIPIVGLALLAWLAVILIEARNRRPAPIRTWEVALLAGVVPWGFLASLGLGLLAGVLLSAYAWVRHRQFRFDGDR